MSISRKQIALLHVARKKLGLDEAEYRSALVELGGVTSSTELDTQGFEAVMGFFEYLGFAPLTAKGPDYGQRAGMASAAQLELIRSLWAEYTRHLADAGDLDKWLLRWWKVSSLRFVTAPQAQKIITALKTMKARSA